MAVTILIALVAALGGAVLALLLARSSRDKDLRGPLDQLQNELRRVSQAQEGLRRDFQQGREASLLGLEETTRALQGQIGQAQRTLAEVRALELSKTSQLDRAADSLKRLEAVVAGSSSRGAAGESILARALAQLPPDMLESNVAFAGKVVEYALRLPGDRLLPIDSKWTSVSSLERLAAADDPDERRRLVEQVGREVRTRMRELAKYLDPERTLAIGVLAVPDAVYAAAPDAHADGHRQGVLIVPYSLALPYVLALYRLAVRFSAAVDHGQLAARLRDLDHALGQMEEEVEGRLARGLVQIGNACDALGDHVRGARRTTARLLQTADTAEQGPQRELLAGPPLSR
jgi:DNA recombination protein RmuC